VACGQVEHLSNEDGEDYIVLADEKASFIAAARGAIADGTFVRITLGKYRGNGDVQKAVASLVMLKEAPHLRIVLSEARRDVTEAPALEDGLQRIAELVGSDFLNVTLFTTAKDLTLSFNKKKEAQLIEAKPTFKEPPASRTHNREKKHAIEPSRPYLKRLGISQDDGTVKPSMYPKFKQISHFIEIVDDLVRASPLRDEPSVSAVDIGSGKGYLTFALYDFLNAKLRKSASVHGIEVRPDLVEFCAGLAKKVGFKGLSFEAASADKASMRAADITIALHACDTATDDAFAEGIAANSALIICAPCCQYELAPQLSRPGEALDGLVKYGLFKQRQADLVTDAARCLLLEASGYKVKVIEFVSTEHTAKNLLIAAIRDAHADRAAAARQYEALKAYMGFKTQHLETRLSQISGFALGGKPAS
jgi:hypothetical protein